MQQLEQTQEERAAAPAHAAEATAETTAHDAELEAELGREARGVRQNMRRTAVGISAVALALSAIMLLAKHLAGMESVARFTTSPAFLATFMVLWTAVCVLLAAGTLKPQRRRARLVEAVARRDDIGAAGALMDGLSMDSPRARRVAAERLIHLLPLVRASDADQFTPERRARLNRILATPVESALYKDVRDLFRPAVDREVRLRVAILRALEQVGDASALPAVQRLARQTPRTPGERAIHAAANECLPSLQARADHDRRSRTLLRAADSPAPASALLRPAASGETPVERLLRPPAPDADEGP